MNILYLSNNTGFDSLYFWINKRKEVKSILYYSDKLNEIFLNKFKPDLIISYGYRYIISGSIVKEYKNKIMNLHISYLPFNRGADPNVWSILEGTTKGVTIHFIDEGIDTGDILFQKEVTYDEEENTLASSYNLLQYEIQQLFKENWKEIVAFDYHIKKQIGLGTFHYVKDFNAIKDIILGDEGWNVSIIEAKNRYQNFLKEIL
jgi:methionyl-tRNA formyltransferase